MPDLTPQQAEALRTLDWIFSNEEADRQMGRTFVLALAYLRRACHFPPGTWFTLIDHYEPEGLRPIVNALESITANGGFDPYTFLKIERHNKRFQFTQPPPFRLRDYFLNAFTEPQESTGNKFIDYIRVHPGLTASELSTALQVHTPASMGALLARWVKNGHLRREGGPHHGGWRYFPVGMKTMGPTSWAHILKDGDL